MAIISLGLCWMGCSPRQSERWLDPYSVSIEQSDPDKNNRKRWGLNQVCGKYEHYIPLNEKDNSLAIRTILMEFHFMNSSDSTLNFPENRGVSYVQEMVDAVNEGFKKNQPMWLPLGNATPVRPVQVKCQIADHPNMNGSPAVYFHYDDELYYFIHRGANRNNSDPAVFKKYKSRDSVLSVFIMPHHRDSIASATYPTHEAGISLREGLKLAGLFENNKMHGSEGRGLLAHELGHTLGLSHTWPGYDGCDDTPAHTNCWNFGPEPPCDKEVSNNLMDYNPYQTSLSPCQIGKIHLQMAKIGSPQRQITKHDWCDLDTTFNVFLSDSASWEGSKDLKGNLILLDGAHLDIYCRVSMPQNSFIYIAPGATLNLHEGWIHQSCGGKWEGIKIGLQGKKQGKLTLIGDCKIEHTTQHAEIIPIQSKS